MKIAFLGKGGSGKSTLSSTLVRHLRAQGIRVLAIDADHNMDLSFNLGADPTVFLGSDPERIKEYAGVPRTSTYADALAQARERNVSFTLSPRDPYTAEISTELNEGLLLITAGPHTARVRSGDYCSHSLAAPLKIYLPLLKLKQNEAVVIDERAGTDPVATGILKGVDLAVIVEEPTIYSQRVAKQIEHELELAGIRSIIVKNKIAGITPEEVVAGLPSEIYGGGHAGRS